jgi:hypothetical protein
MSLRDFNTPMSDDPTALHHAPLGNNSGLSEFHTVSVDEREPSNTPKIVGALAIALMVGAAAIGLYAYSGSSTQPVVADSELPKTAPVTPPVQQAMAPEASMTPAAPEAMIPAPEATPAPAASPKPVRSARLSPSTRMAAAQPAPAAQAPASQGQPAQITQEPQTTPLPAAPTPSPSDVASATPAVPNNAPSAADIPAQATVAPQEAQSSTPQASDAAPAQDQQSGATPAPAAQ